MKSLHRPDIFAWSVFDEGKNVDFHGFVWVRPAGNVVVDPVAMSPHDKAHLAALGGVRWIVITNSDHVRASAELALEFGAEICAPAAEEADFPIGVSRWLSDGDAVVPGLEVFALEGSKTRGELALLLDETTLFTGDLVRAHAGGALMMLPDAKLADRATAIASVARLGALPMVEAVLVGDGWLVFRDGADRLAELCVRLGA
jgi:hypothetical protein